MATKMWLELSDFHRFVPGGLLVFSVLCDVSYA